MLKLLLSVLMLVPLVFLNLHKSSSPIAKPVNGKEFEYCHNQERPEDSQHSFSRFD